MINMKDTNKEIKDFKKEWEEKADEVLISDFVDWAGQISKEENFNTNLKKQRHPCNWFWTSIVVLWDGRVVPCCKDCDAKLVLGNLNKQTIKEVWNGKRFREIRKQQIRGKFANKLCYNCHEAVGRPLFK